MYLRRKVYTWGGMFVCPVGRAKALSSKLSNLIWPVDAGQLQYTGHFTTKNVQPAFRIGGSEPVDTEGQLCHFTQGTWASEHSGIHSGPGTNIHAYGGTSVSLVCSPTVNMVPSLVSQANVWDFSCLGLGSSKRKELPQCQAIYIP